MEKLGDRAEDVFEKIAELPLDQMLDDLRKALQSLRELLDSRDLKGTVAGTRRSTEALEPALKDARQAIADARTLIKQLDGQAQGVSADARRTMEEARQALEQSRRSMERLNNAVAGAEDTRVTAAETLEQLSQTLKALRNLVDYIQTHPEAVVLGKPKRGRRRRNEARAGGGDGGGLFGCRARRLRFPEADAGGPLLRAPPAGRASRDAGRSRGRRGGRAHRAPASAPRSPPGGHLDGAG